MCWSHIKRLPSFSSDSFGLRQVVLKLWIQKHFVQLSPLCFYLLLCVDEAVASFELLDRWTVLLHSLRWPWDFQSCIWPYVWSIVLYLLQLHLQIAPDSCLVKFFALNSFSCCAIFAHSIMTVNIWISWIAAQSNACISICSNRYWPLFLHGYSLDLSFVLASWPLAQGIWILWYSLKFCPISWARLRIPFSKSAWGRSFLDYDSSLATIDDHSISLLWIIEIDASLGSHSKLQVIIIKDFDST